MKPKEKFVVIVRVKPTNQQDRELYTPKQMENMLKFNSNLITINKKSFEDRVYQFNHIYHEETQSVVYEQAEHLVLELFEGYNATFLAYGQTGTGKTHTVFGSKQAVLESNYKHQDAGIFYRTAATLFEEIHKRMSERQFSVRISFIEFYLDNIYDLLAQRSEDQRSDNGQFRKVELKDTPKDGVVVKDLTEIAVRSYEELVNSVKKAVRQRRTQATTINQKSSRSHAVIQITLMQRWKVADGTGGIQMKTRKGTLKIVDLAGSERVSKTESEGTRLEEAKRINKQITTLGKCITSLVAAQKTSNSKVLEMLIQVELSDKFSINKVHVPFRDCKLTRFLSDSLQGKCKIVLCVCISPFAVHSQETFSSLLFANQASTLKVDARRNEQFVREEARSVSPLNNSRESFETPIKQRLKTETKDVPVPLFKNTNNAVSKVQQRPDVEAVGRLRTDIRLIQDQISGNFQQMDLSSIPRPVLEKTLRTYSELIRQLQQQLESTTVRLTELQKKRY